MEDGFPFMFEVYIHDFPLHSFFFKWNRFVTLKAEWMEGQERNVSFLRPSYYFC